MISHSWAGVSSRSRASAGDWRGLDPSCWTPKAPIVSERWLRRLAAIFSSVFLRQLSTEMARYDLAWSLSFFPGFGIRIHLAVLQLGGWMACLRGELYSVHRCPGMAVWTAAIIYHRMPSASGAEFMEVEARALYSSVCETGS